MTYGHHYHPENSAHLSSLFYISWSAASPKILSFDSRLRQVALTLRVDTNLITDFVIAPRHIRPIENHDEEI